MLRAVPISCDITNKEGLKVGNASARAADRSQHVHPHPSISAHR